MRLGTIVICLALGGFAGWIAGTLYPAPQALLSMIKLGGVEQSDSALTEDATQSPEAASPAAAPGEDVQVAAAPTPSGPADEATLNQYRAWISEARQRHPYADSEARMYAVMMCESRGQASIVNPAGPYSGLFQYSPATWGGFWNQYREENILDARAQIFATALAWRSNMQGQWGCYNRAH
jgi:hypothetical protein